MIASFKTRVRLLRTKLLIGLLARAKHERLRAYLFAAGNRIPGCLFVGSGETRTVGGPESYLCIYCEGRLLVQGRLTAHTVINSGTLEIPNGGLTIASWFQ